MPPAFASSKSSEELPEILARRWPRRTVYAVASLADCPAAEAARGLNDGLSCVRSSKARAKILAAARHIGIEPREVGRATSADDETTPRSVR